MEMGGNNHVKLQSVFLAEKVLKCLPQSKRYLLKSIVFIKI
jgi:hypothetical protein